ncbi:MAG: hypothetical protein M3Y25_09605 [Thermoproteota archaeon]|nr:hypothetical protein [Thermoproteota archaeon]
MVYKIDKDTKFDLTKTAMNTRQSRKVKSSHSHQDSNTEREHTESRTSIFSQLPENKKSEIVYGQIQRNKNRLPNLN